MPEHGLSSFTHPPLPGSDWDANADLTVSVERIPPPTLDETALILNIPNNDTNTLVAHDTLASELGQLPALITGTQNLDLNANNALVDEEAGTIQVVVGPNQMGTAQRCLSPEDTAVDREATDQRAG